MPDNVKMGRVEIEIAARLDKLQKGFRAAEKEAEAAGKKIVDAVSKGAAEGQRGSQAVGETVTAAVEAAAESAVPAAAEAGREVAAAVASGVSSGTRAAESAGEEVVQAVEKGVSSGTRDAEGAGKQVAKAVEKGVTNGAGGAEAAGKKMGARVAKGAASSTGDVVKALREGFATKMADAREELTRGLIDKREFQKRAQEAAGEFNRAILERIRRLAESGKLTPELHTKLTKELKDTGESAGTAFGSSFQARIVALFASGWITRVLVGSLRGLAEGIAQKVEEAGAAVQARVGFTRLASGRGLSAADTLAELRSATNGAVSGMELMRRSNLLLNSELPLTAKSVGELAFLSRRLAEAQGKDAAEGFDRVTRGIAKLEPELLDELGLTVRVEEATKRWAAANHRNAESLTSAEKVLAFYTAVVEQARAKVAALGDEEITAATRIQQMAAFWTDLKVAITAAIAESPRIEAFFRAMGMGAMDAADRVQDLADRVGALVDSGSGSILGALLGGATGATAGFLSPVPGGMAVGGILGAFAGSGLGQLADAGGPTYEQALAARQAESSARTRMEQIRAEVGAESDLKKLEQQRVELRQQLRDLQRENAGDARALNETMERLRATEERIAQLNKRPGDPILSNAELNKIKAAVKALEERIHEYQSLAPLREIGVKTTTPDTVEGQLQRIYEIEKEVRGIEEQIAAARGRAPVQIKEVVAALEAERAVLKQNIASARAQWEHLPAVEAKLAKTLTVLRGMQTAAVSMGDGTWRTATGALDGITHATKELTKAQRELDRAQYSRDPERIARALKQQKAALEAVRAARAAATRVFETGAKQGLISQLELNDLFAKMVELLKQAGLETKDLAEKGRDWKKVAEQIAGAGRGILSVADALGIVDNQSRRTLQGLVDVAEAAARIAANPADIGSWAQGIGGLVGMIQGLFSGPDAEAARRVQAEQLSATYQLVRALEELRSAVLSQISLRQKGEISAAGESFVDRYGFGGYHRRPDGSTVVVGDKLDLQKLAAEDYQFLRRLEELTGQEFFDESTGKMDWKLFKAAWEAFQKADVGSFGSDLMGRLDALDYAFQVAGDVIGDAQKKLEMYVDTVRDFAPEFADVFQRILSEQGEDAARAWLQQQATLFAQPGGATNLGAWAENLTSEQIRRIIAGGIARLDDVASDAGSTTSYQVSRSITEVTANRMVGVLTTIAFWVEQIARGLGLGAGIPAGMDAGATRTPTPPSMGVPRTGADTRPWIPSASFGAIPPGSMPSSAPVRVPASGAGAPALIGTLNVQVTPPLGMSVAEATQLGRAVGAGVLQKTDEQLGRRLRDRKRAAGSNLV